MILGGSAFGVEKGVGNAATAGTASGIIRAVSFRGRSTGASIANDGGFIGAGTRTAFGVISAAVFAGLFCCGSSALLACSFARKTFNFSCSLRVKFLIKYFA